VILGEKGNCSSKLLLGSGRGEGGAAQHREEGAWEKLIAILGRRGIHFQKCLKGSVMKGVVFYQALKVMVMPNSQMKVWNAEIQP